MPLVQRLLVLGGGSAGFLAALACKKHVPNLEVTVLRSPELGIIGVGEGTTPIVVHFLHGFLDIDPAAFYPKARPSWKLGIRFIWGTRPYFNYSFHPQLHARYPHLSRANGFYCFDDMEHAELASSLMSQGKVFLRQPDGSPILGNDTAYHLENETFVGFLEQHALEQRIAIIEGRVVQVERDEQGISGLRLESGVTLQADLYVDCSGFRSELLGQALGEPFYSFDRTLLCDRAVVGGWPRAGEPVLPYTTSETMDAGWSWQIEHEQRINRGYVYSSDFISDAEAEAEFRRQNPKLTETRVVKFVSGRYRRGWVDNVVAMGNACGFVEPLESTSLSVICQECEGLAKTLRDSSGIVHPTHAIQYNKLHAQLWDRIRWFLSVHYRFNERLETSFWRACQQDVDIGDAQELVDYYTNNGPNTTWGATLVHPHDFFGLDGYWTLLVGQKVPHQCAYQPGPEEVSRWNEVRRTIQAKAAAGLTVDEALAVVRSQRWSWNREFYRALVR
jgi:tryptophan halogenase